MAGRWRTWNLDCLEETLASRPREEEVEPLILAGSLKEIPYINLSSIVLPKEALSLAYDDGSLRSRGRGRSLANRALASNKPSRRPGEGGSSDKARSNVERVKSVGSSKSTLQSRFLGSEELYEDLFPSLGQPACKTETKTSIVPKWGNKPTRERPSSLDTRKDTEGTRIEGSFFEEPKEKSKSNETVDFGKSSNDKNSMNIADISNNLHKAETSGSIYKNSKHSTSNQEYVTNNDNTIVVDAQFSFNGQKSDSHEFKATWIVSGEKNVTLRHGLQFNDNEVNTHDQPLDKLKTADVLNSDKKDRIGSKHNSPLFPHGSICDVENQLIRDKLEPGTNLDDDNRRESENENNSFQESNDVIWICDQLCECPDEETVCYEETKQLEISQLDMNTENNAGVLFNQQHSVDGDLSLVGKHETIILSAKKDEVEKLVKQNDSNDNSDASMDDTSTNELEMDPCIILLENLPLAMTEEELKEIVEPYGEMVSYNFQDHDTSKICNIRMPCSLSGELLVVSLDGLEVNGYRIKATMTTEA